MWLVRLVATVWVEKQGAIGRDGDTHSGHALYRGSYVHGVYRYCEGSCTRTVDVYGSSTAGLVIFIGL